MNKGEDMVERVAAADLHRPTLEAAAEVARNFRDSNPIPTVYEAIARDILSLDAGGGGDAEGQRARRDAALSELKVFVTAIYGDRCSTNEAGCMGCCAWGLYDMMDRMTDSSLLDELPLPPSVPQLQPDSNGEKNG